MGKRTVSMNNQIKLQACGYPAPVNSGQNFHPKKGLTVQWPENRVLPDSRLHTSEKEVTLDCLTCDMGFEYVRGAVKSLSSMG